jgi:hypothetical protein
VTADEFDRILTSLRHVSTVTVLPLGNMVPLRAVIEILHSNLHHEDKALYEFDWATNSFKKKPPE